MIHEAYSESREKAVRRAKILVLDDDDDVRTVTRDSIKELGYEVVALGDPREALDRLAKESFDLLITDVAMPGMTGVEVARHVRADGSALPIVFSSGYADVQSLGEELSDEVVLKKPFRLMEISARIEAALNSDPLREPATV